MLHVFETSLELFYYFFTSEPPVQTQTHTDKFSFLYIYIVCKKKNINTNWVLKYCTKCMLEDYEEINKT